MGLIDELSTKRIHIEEKIRGNILSICLRSQWFIIPCFFNHIRNDKCPNDSRRIMLFVTSVPFWFLTGKYALKNSSNQSRMCLYNRYTIFCQRWLNSKKSQFWARLFCPGFVYFYVTYYRVLWNETKDPHHIHSLRSRCFTKKSAFNVAGNLLVKRREMHVPLKSKTRQRATSRTVTWAVFYPLIWLAARVRRRFFFSEEEKRRPEIRLRLAGYFSTRSSSDTKTADLKSYFMNWHGFIKWLGLSICIFFVFVFFLPLLPDLLPRCFVVTVLNFKLVRRFLSSEIRKGRNPTEWGCVDFKR